MMGTMAGDATDGLTQATNISVVIEASLIAMLMVDAEGRILLVNSQTEHLFGYRRDELLTMTVDQLVPERFRGGHPALRAGFFRHPAPRPMGMGRDLFGVRKDGVEMPIEIGLSPVDLDGRTYVVASVVDITLRQRAEQSRREQAENSLRRSMIDSLPVSVVATDRAGTIISVNPAAVQLLGYPSEELVGREVTVLHDPAELERRTARLARSDERRTGSAFATIVRAGRATRQEDREWTLLRKDGATVPVTVSVTELGRGGEDGYLLVADDISVRRRAESTIRHMARHDALTGLANRELLDERLAEELAEASTTGGRVAVLVLNIDGFKRVNDALGHRGGDALLVDVAHRIEQQVGPRDVVARLGADQFVAMLREPSAPASDDPRVEAILAAVARPSDVGGHALQITASIGVACYPEDARDGAALLQEADLAMNAGKETGQGGVARYVPEMLERSRSRMDLEAALPEALANGELTLVFQPQVELPGRRTVSVETLSRWTRDGVPVSPAEFIPVAEQSDLILELGRWTLLDGCRQIADVNARTGRALRVAVNVSPRQFQSAYLLGAVEDALGASGLAPELLELEITEGILMQDPIAGVALLRELRALGLTTAMDDFGTGYSSLSYLTRFPLDTLKIDQSFVRRLGTDPADAAVVDAIIAMAHSLDMTVLAEGVETDEQEAYLVSHGCDIGQGFRYSRGIPAEELVAFLAREP